jgi:hypothetical protein
MRQTHAGACNRCAASWCDCADCSSKYATMSLTHAFELQHISIYHYTTMFATARQLSSHLDRAEQAAIRLQHKRACTLHQAVRAILIVYMNITNPHIL